MDSFFRKKMLATTAASTSDIADVDKLLLTPGKARAEIILEQVSLIFENRLVFSGMSMNLAQGAKVALLGKSGVGKSSLLKLIAAIHQPSSGTIKNSAERIGYVFQEPRLLPWLTVEQNIMQVMKAAKFSPEYSHKKIASLLEQVSLSHCHDYYPHQLSGGMAQRVSLVRAFAIEPQLLLLDEPFSALDTQMAQQLTQVLAELLTNEVSMIYVSHHVEQVLPLSNLALVLKENNEFDWHSVADQGEREFFLNQLYANEVY